MQSTPLSSPVWRAATVVVEMYSLMGMVAGVTSNFVPFCSKDFSCGVSSFLERLITHLSWKLDAVQKVTAVSSSICSALVMFVCIGLLVKVCSPHH